MNFSKNEIRFYLITITFIALSPAIMFFKEFGTESVKSDISTWGAFGDFFFGYLGCLISFLNLIIFYKISIDIKISNEKINASNLNYNKYINKIEQKTRVLDEFSSFIEKTNSHIDKINLNPYRSDKKIIYNTIDEFNIILDEIKKVFDNDVDNNIIKRYLFIIEDIHNDLRINTNIITNISKNLTKLNSNYKNFHKALKIVKYSN